MSINPVLNRFKKNSIDKGHQGKLAEAEMVKRTGGRGQPGSGSLAGAKGDVKFNIDDINFLAENKTSTSNSFTVKRDHLLKIYQEALEVARVPALSFQFVDAQGRSDKKDRWICLPEHLLMELLEE